MHYRIGRVRLAQAKKAGSETLIAQAREQFELELRRDPSNANAAYELGELQRRAGEFDQAALSFGAAVSADAGFAEAFVGLGRTLIDLGRPADAIAPLTRATSLEPDDQVAVYQLAQAHQRIGNTAEQRLALEQFERLRANRREGGPLGTGRLDVTKQELPEGVH
jgi:predicted Zn-dependent protease